MPSGPIHPYWSVKQTGFPCFRTHRAIDSYAQIMGSKHREYFHQPLEAMAVANIVDGPQCIPAGANHVAIDQIYKDPESKILFELVRLTDTAPPTLDPNSPESTVRALNRGFKQQQRRRW